MERELDSQDAAKHFGVSIRTIQRGVESGRLKGRFVEHSRAGKGGMKLMVVIDDTRCTMDEGREKKETTAEQEPKLKKISSRIVESSTKWQPTAGTTKIARGEPGCHVETTLRNGEPVPEAEGSMQKAEGSMQKAVCSMQKAVNEPPPSPGSVIPLCTPSQDGSGDGGATSNLPAIIVGDSTLRNDTKIIPASCQHDAYLRLAILKFYREKISENHKPKGQVTEEFIELYNSGFLLPTIYNDIKSISRATLYSWDRAEKFGGVRALTPLYGGSSGSKITENEKYILLNILLHQNRLKIGSAIKFAKTLFAYKKIESPSSESTLRRFIDEFKRTRYDAWVEAREGAKALNDKCLPYAERDWRLLTVGEGLVADGHRLNFQVINPFTGKSCRAVIVLFWDWKSSYPLGWEIMLEESIQCIASALRNAILCLGKIPKWLLIDNGKAFKAKVFTSDLDLEDGITYGMFATLGIHTHFSQAYNPQEKPLERFWGTFNNWFERLVPSYTGASIPDKPPYMLRNEEDAKARHNDWVPKIEEVQEMLLKFREFYAGQPSRGRDGLTPREIFEAEKGPGVDPDELAYLMMAKEIKSVGRNGVTWNGWHYYDEALYGYRDKVICRYTNSDYSKIYLFSLKNQFLCVARPVEQVHPMASESEFPRDQQAVKNIASLKNRAKRSTKNLLTLIETNKQIDWEDTMKRSPEAFQVVQAIQRKQGPKKLVSLSSQEEIERFEIQADEEEPFQFETFSDKYEFLLKKTGLTELEIKWIHQFRSGEIAPGEWKLLYAEKEGENASQVYPYEECQEICVSG